MSLSTSMSNALTGLNAASLQTEVISNNVSNALTPGYATQSVELSANVTNGVGQGVSVTAVTSASDPVTTANRRQSDADLGYASTMGAAQTQLTLAIGTPDTAGSLPMAATDFEAALIGAANDPASSAALSNLEAAAGAYADAINSAAKDVRTVREQADSDIDKMVDEINASLQAIEELNKEIQAVEIGGGNSAALVNERDQHIDVVAVAFPIQTYPRENGAVAIYTTSGGVLLDGTARELGFEPTPIITPDMTLASGGVNGLTINGEPVTIGDGTGTGLYDGGALSAAFEVRDVTAPAVNDSLDAMAADLILRFEDPAVDPTLAVGDPGLFTDNGAAYDPLNTVGLASSISLNAAVDPSAGGEVYRLRDGINATAPGNISSSTTLDNMLTAATTSVAPPPGSGVAGPVTVTGFAIEVSGNMATAQFQADSNVSYAAAFNDGLRQSESASIGVSTDAELQKLILVEQAYAANARVISVIDDLIRQLLEI